MFEKTRKTKQSKKDSLPLARTEELVVQSFEGEILIYDIKSDKAHNLNKIISLVWSNCDGKTSLGEMLLILENETKSQLDFDFVLLALKELHDANLLTTEMNKTEYKTISRREIISKYAVSAMTLPVIISLVAPTSAQMASCLPTGQIGCNTTPCCPGNTCQAIVGPGGIIEQVCVATP